jgi:hypothetical protein
VETGVVNFYRDTMIVGSASMASVAEL